MIASPHLSTTLIYDVSHWWYIYINRCMTVSHSEYLGATGEALHLSVEPILLELEGGRCMGQLLTGSLENLFSRRCGSGDRGSI